MGWGHRIRSSPWSWCGPRSSSLFCILTSWYCLDISCFRKRKGQCFVSFHALNPGHGLHNFKIGENNLFRDAAINMYFPFHQLPEPQVLPLLEARLDFPQWEILSDLQQMGSKGFMPGEPIHHVVFLSHYTLKSIRNQGLAQIASSITTDWEAFEFLNLNLIMIPFLMFCVRFMWALC